MGEHPRRSTRLLKLSAGKSFGSWCPGTTTCSYCQPQGRRKQKRLQAFYLLWNQSRQGGLLAARYEGAKKKPLEDHDRDEGEAGRDHRWAGVNAGDYVKD